MQNKIILHCDMNNFYASVECKKDPSLAVFPVAVGGDVEERTGIILAKNYIAKSYGVKTGDTVYEAVKKCPGLKVLPPDFREYVRHSHLAKEIYQRYTDMVEPFGLDECWLDVTASRGLFGDGETIANKIRNDIKKELGITASVGVSFNKIFAKLGSDMKKPDAVTIIDEASFRQTIWHLPASDLMGVGRKTLKKINSVGIYTIGQLAKYPKKELKSMLGKWGEYLWQYANGLDDSPVVPGEIYIPEKSIGHGITTRKDMTDKNEVWCVMLELCQEIGHRLYSCNMAARGIAIQIKDNKFNVKQWQKKVYPTLQSPFKIATEAYSLFNANYTWNSPVRAVSIRAIDLYPKGEGEQIDIFRQSDEKNLLLDMTVEKLRERYGKDIIKNGCLLNHPLLGRDISSLTAKMAEEA